jgi:hypothetical protein
LEAEVLWSGLEFVMMVALSSKLYDLWTTHGLIRLSKSLSPVEYEAILVYFSYLFLLVNKMIVNYEKSLKMKEINRSGESKKEKERSTKDCQVNIEQFERH